jgi:hypothetical protein
LQRGRPSASFPPHPPKRSNTRATSPSLRESTQNHRACKALRPHAPVENPVGSVEHAGEGVHRPWATLLHGAGSDLHRHALTCGFAAPPDVERSFRTGFCSPSRALTKIRDAPVSMSTYLRPIDYPQRVWGYQQADVLEYERRVARCVSIRSRASFTEGGMGAPLHVAPFAGAVPRSAVWPAMGPSASGQAVRSTMIETVVSTSPGRPADRSQVHSRVNLPRGVVRQENAGPFGTTCGARSAAIACGARSAA